MTTHTHPASTGRANEPSAVAYIWWLLVGALFGFATAGMLTIGILLMPVVAVLVAIGLLVRPLRAPRAMLTIPGGLAVVPLYIAWLNRGGPGDVCTTLGNGGIRCTQEWSPWPFVAMSLVLVALTAVLVPLMRRGTPPV